MRIYPSTIGRVKRKAKLLQRLVNGVSLSKCQETIAAALGFRDWRGLHVACNGAHKTSQLDDVCSASEVAARMEQQIGVFMERLAVSYSEAKKIWETLSLTGLVTRAQNERATKSAWYVRFKKAIDDFEDRANNESSRKIFSYMRESLSLSAKNFNEIEDCAQWFFDEGIAKGIVEPYSGLACAISLHRCGADARATASSNNIIATVSS